MLSSALLLLTAGCSAPTVNADVELLIRSSMALRGVRPSVAEMTAVRDDPDSATGLIAAWVNSPGFGATMRDLHAADLILRSENHQLPGVGLLEGLDGLTVNHSVMEEPLKLIEWVIGSDQPYSAIVTSDRMLADPMVSRVWGVEIPADASYPLGDDWALTTWGDDRPAAGVLVSNALYMRHTSSGANYNRARANWIARAFVCQDFLVGDIPIDDLAFSDERSITEALRTNPACIACHDSLDPIASALFGFVPMPSSRAIEAGCKSGGEPCYPLTPWDASKVGAWAEVSQPEPAWFGTPVADLSAVGQAIAADPRFATCAARRFLGWFTHEPFDAVSSTDADALADGFVASGLNARSLALATVATESFATAEPMAVRPEQLSRMVEDLTGYVWAEDTTDLMGSDLHGWRGLTAAVDNYYVTVPDAGSSATRVLVTQRLAERAALHVVAHDVAAPADERILLTEPGHVDRQLAALHLRILGEFEPDIGLTRQLFQDAGGGDHGYAVVIAAMLQDARLTWY